MRAVKVSLCVLYIAYTAEPHALGDDDDDHDLVVVAFFALRSEGTFSEEAVKLSRQVS